MSDKIRKIQFWVDKNRNKIENLINDSDSLDQFDLYDLINNLKETDDLSKESDILFQEMSIVIFYSCLNKNLGLEDLKRAVKRAANFATLWGFAKNIYADDLYKKFPFEYVKPLFLKGKSIDE